MGRGTIARSRDFRRIFSSGARARRDGITVWVARGVDPRSPSRLGLAVRRAAGNAVTRNRIKRRVRAAFVEADVPTGFDVVARAEGEVAGRNFQEVIDDLRGALRAAGMEISA